MNEKSASKAEILDGTVQLDDNHVDIDSDLKTPKTSSTDTSVKEIDEPKASINTRKAAEAVASGAASGYGSAPATFSRGGTTFSGGAGQVGDDLSATTRGVSSYRSGDRTGKRQDSITKKLDLLNAEIIKTKMYQSKPLSETDAKQGYNGNYENDHAITQKANGGAPADPLFERSADEIRMDMMYYADGQYVNKSSDYGEYDIKSYNVQNQSYEDDYIGKMRGSYLNKKLKFRVHKSGAISHFAIDTDDISSRGVDEATYRAASDSALRTINRREIDRNIMIAKAGNESDPKWSCLGDAIPFASAQNMFIADLDASIGDMVYLSRRKLAQALSYQINKTAKDGSRVTGPMAEMVNGLVPNGNGALNTVLEESGIHETFYNFKNLSKGSAALWLKTNDSIPKYTTKGKMLSLPLSFKSALNIAIANANPLRMHEQFKQLVEKNELFSTIDGPYDPLKSIIHTNAATVVIPYNIATNISYATDDSNKLKPSFDIYTMHYENLRNRYNIVIKDYFLSGIFRFLNERGSRLWQALTSGVDNITYVDSNNNAVDVEIPIVSTSGSISLWDLIVCSAVPYMIEERIETLTEVLKYERNFEYPYSGTVSLKDVDICHAENFSFTDTDTELTSAIAKPVAAMKVIMPEVFWPVAYKTGEAADGSNGNAVEVVLPHYFVQNQFVYDRDTDEDQHLILSDEFATMAYPSTRSGQMFGYMDTIYGMSEEDYRLSLDRMVVYPGYQGTEEYKTKSKFAATVSAGGKITYNKARVYKYGLTTDGQPVLSYFGYANSQDDKDKTLTVHDVISTPRELGLLQVAPAGLLTPVKYNSDSEYNMVDTNSSFLGFSGPGFKMIIYRSQGTVAETEILTPGSTNVAISGSLRGIWDTVCANEQGAKFNQGWALNAQAGNKTFSPFVSGSFSSSGFTYDEETGTYQDAEVKDTELSVNSRMQYMWTRMQRLPFAMNPFDTNSHDITTGATSEYTNINSVDIFDFLYMLNLAGFRASDYSELANERVKYRIVKGMDYVDDPYVSKSMLLK